MNDDIAVNREVRIALDQTAGSGHFISLQSIFCLLLRTAHAVHPPVR